MTFVCLVLSVVTGYKIFTVKNYDTRTDIDCNVTNPKGLQTVFMLRHMIQKLTILPFFLLFCWAGSAIAQTIALNPGHPDRYVVVKGDTLWDISARFLRAPWLWPEVWQVNPQISNPHLIYPGDIIALELRDGKPVLRLHRSQNVVKLSPRMREQPLDQAIPTVDPDAIHHFLNQARVVTKEELELAPYVLGGVEKRLLAGITGERIYARGIPSGVTTRYGVYRVGEVYRNPNNKKEILGHEAVRVAGAMLDRAGDPATLLITDVTREIRTGDRLLPLGDNSTSNQYYFPHAPQPGTKGRIISVFDGASMAGQYQAVVLDLGRQQDIKTGHVLAVYQSNGRMKDPVTGEDIKLPGERAGTLLVFRTFDKVSYALLMESTRPVHVLDAVRAP